MNLRSRFAWVRVAGLVSVLGLVACDSGSADTKADEKKAEPAQAPEVKAEVKAEPKVETPPVVTPDPAGDVKAADTAADGDTKAADAAGDTKAADAAGDTKAGDTKAGDTKTGDAKATATKKPADKPADKAPAIDGKPLYDSKCKVCHGADGKGTEAMKKNKIPDMSDKGWQGKHAKAAVAKAISEGVDGTKMKAFKDKLKPEEIDAIAAYVKKLK